MCSKRCNSNDAISVFEILARELRATLLSNLSSRGLRGLTAVHVGGGGARPDHARRRPIGGRREACGARPDHARRRPIGGRREACGARPDHARRRPIGGRREACGAWPGFETTRRAKLAARTASGRAGLAAAGDLAATGNRAAAGDQAATQSDRHDQTDAIRQKVVAPRKTWGPPLMRSLT